MIKSISSGRRIILMPAPPDDRDLDVDEFKKYYWVDSKIYEQTVQIANKTEPLPKGKIRCIIDK